MINTTRPAAYVRKSHADAASAASQLEAIKELATRQGVTTPLAVYADVGVSGRHGMRGAKSDWRRLHDDIASGVVSVVYLTALDRAGRSLREWLDFTELCVSKGVEVRDQSGVDRASGDAEDIAIIEMMMAQREGKKAVERSARGKATQMRRGDDVYQGRSPYGWKRVRVDADGNIVNAPDGRIVQVPNPEQPVQPLIDAISATRGNVLQASKIVGIDPRVMTRALDSAGALRGRRAPVGGRRRAPSDAPLSRLVECHCGTLMTPARDRRTKQWASLYCARGHKLGAPVHGRYVARSRFVLDALRREIPRKSSIAILRSTPADTEARRRALEATKRKLGIALADDAIEEAEYRKRMDAVKAELADLGDAESEWIGFGPRTPNVDWSADDIALGEALRRLVRVVRLDADMMPAEVVLRGATATARA